jgi:hypothetical protein
MTTLTLLFTCKALFYLSLSCLCMALTWLLLKKD